VLSEVSLGSIAHLATMLDLLKKMV